MNRIGLQRKFFTASLVFVFLSVVLVICIVSFAMTDIGNIAILASIIIVDLFGIHILLLNRLQNPIKLINPVGYLFLSNEISV